MKESLAKEKGLWTKNAVIEDRYEVRGLARGGMGEVYFTYDREIGRMMAVKTPLPSVLKSADGLKRFYREAEAWIGLGIHPNICSAYYVQEIEGIPRLFIEYVDGGSLDRWILENKLPSLRDKIDIAIQIAAGMMHAHIFSWSDDEGIHHTGLVHRDLKPANVLMSRYGAALLTDFGLVRLGKEEELKSGFLQDGSEGSLDLVNLIESLKDGIAPAATWQTITIGGVPMGTPQYMAPEQFENPQLASYPADIYAFGCILYELFCQRRPFLLSDEHRRAVIYYQITMWQKMHKEDPPPRPETLNPDIDKELSRLMLKCLEKDPSERPESFNDIRLQLKNIYKRLIATEYPRAEPKTGQLQADSFNNQAVSYATINQLNRAENALHQALSLNSDHIEANFNQTLLQLRKGDISEDDAYRRIERFLQNQFYLGYSEFLMSKLFLYSCDYYNAILNLKKAVKSYDKVPEAFKYLGFVLCSLDTGLEDEATWKEAKNSFQKMIELGKEDLSVVTGYSYSKKALGEDYSAYYEEMRQNFKELPEKLEDAAYLYLPGFSSNRLFYDEESDITSITYTHDGRHIIAGYMDWKINVFDAVTGVLIRSLKGHSDRINTLSVSSDNSYLLSASKDKTLCLWDLESGRLEKTFEGHEKDVTSAVFAASDKAAISASKDSTIRAWSVQKGKSAGHFKVYEKGVSALAVSPDWQHVYTVNKSDPLCKWLLKSGKLADKFSEPHFGAECIDISADGRFLLTGGAGKIVCLWDSQSCKCVKTFKGHSGKINAVKFSFSGIYAFSCDDNTLRVWQVQSGLLYGMFKYTGPIYDINPSPVDNVLIIASGKDAIIVRFLNRYPISYVLAIPASIREEEIRFESINRLAQAKEELKNKNYEDFLKHISDLRTFSNYERSPEALELIRQAPPFLKRRGLHDPWIVKELTGHISSVTGLAITYDGKFIYSASSDGSVRKWDVELGKSFFVSEVGKEGINCLSLSYCGKIIAIGCEDNKIRLLDAATGECTKTLKGHEDTITSLAFTSDSLYIFSASLDKTIRLWSTKAIAPFGRFEKKDYPIYSILLNSDEKTLLSGCDENLLVQWDCLTGKLLNETKGHTREIKTLALSPDSAHFLAGGADNTISLWSAKTIKKLKIYEGHDDEVLSAAFSPDGQYFASGCKDGTINIWEVSSGKCIYKIEGHDDGISGLSFSPDGWNLFSAGFDNRIIMWFLDWNVTHEETNHWEAVLNARADKFLLAQIQKGGGSKIKPSWSDEDLQSFKDRLTFSGYSFVIGAILDEKLNSLVNTWKKPRIDRTALIIDRVKTKAEIEKEQEVEVKRSRLYKFIIPTAVGAALVLILLFLMLTGLRYNNKAIDEYNAKHSDSFMTMAYSAFENFNIQASDCDPSKIEAYTDTLEYFISKNAAATGSLNPISKNNLCCLAKLSKDKDVIDELITIMADNVGTPRANALYLYLSYLGKDAALRLINSLNNSNLDDEGLRLVADTAVIAADKESIAPLLEIANTDIQVQSALSYSLGRLIASKKLTPSEAFALIELLLNHSDDAVRENAKEALHLLKGSKVNKLL
ncbi:serine/threonine protein kinase [Candidatus Magnetoovum chiemensis]|nr:serine/threonine protein kinase [Candidatus Magnetoovum chiemensis]